MLTLFESGPLILVARYLHLDPNGPWVTFPPIRSTNGPVRFGPLSTTYTAEILKYYTLDGVLGAINLRLSFTMNVYTLYYLNNIGW